MTSTENYDPHAAEDDMDEVTNDDLDQQDFVADSSDAEQVSDLNSNMGGLVDDCDDDGSTEVRILLHNADVSIIIGRGGNNIKKLREEQRTIIQMPDSNSIERILNIKGALSDIRATLTAVFTLLARDRRNDTGNSECRLLIHQSHAGPLIGHSGDHIKEMRNKFSLDIKVFSRRCPLSTDRVVLIKGQINGIVDCIFDILNLSKMHPVKGAIQQYDPYNSDEYLAENYGGFVGERRGARSSAQRTPDMIPQRRPRRTSRPPPDAFLHMLPYPWGLNQQADDHHAIGPIHRSNGRQAFHPSMYPAEGFFDDRPPRMDMLRSPYDREFRNTPYQEGPFDEAHSFPHGRVSPGRRVTKRGPPMLSSRASQRFDTNGMEPSPQPF